MLEAVSHPGTFEYQSGLLVILRRRTAALRRYLAPQRDALQRLLRYQGPLLTAEERDEMQMHSDTMLQCVEDIDLIREQVLSFQDEVFNRLVMEQNARMYTLCIVAVIFLLLTFLTGLLGINLGGIPLADSAGGFAVIATLSALIAVILYFVFKRKRWLQFVPRPPRPPAGDWFYPLAPSNPLHTRHFDRPKPGGTDMKAKLPICCTVAASFVAFSASPSRSVAQVEFDEAKVLVEINATDGDVGFHALLDAPEWRWARIKDPGNNVIFAAKAKGALLEQGLTEDFFESSEPVCDPEDAEEDEPVVSLAEFLARFPAGEYAFRGRTLENEKIIGDAELTYDLPAAPDIELTEDLVLAFDPEDAGSTPVVVMWEPGEDLGEKCHDQELVDLELIADPAEVEVIGWEVVTEPADDETLDPNRVFSVQLRGDQNSVQVPPAYLASLWDDVAEEGALWVKFEVGAIEASGNQTFSEGEFCLYEDDPEDCEEGED